jgi:eukaryotic-like serine/threonine-protein kinase
MTTRSTGHLSGLSPDQRAAAEDRIKAFELAWQRGERPAIAEHLPADAVVRLAVLVELVHIDLERRIKAGEDLGRFLRNEPIMARPVGTLERSWRWCRRNPMVASLDAAVAVLLLVSAIGGTTLAVIANRYAERADQNAQRADTNAEESAKNAERAIDEAQKAKIAQSAANAEADHANRLLYLSRIAAAQHEWGMGDAAAAWLGAIYRDPKQNELSRIFATETLADHAADRPDEPFDLLADAEQFQFPVLLDKLASDKDKAVALAHEELARIPLEKASEHDKELLARRQADAAVALLRLREPEKVWPVLKFSPDPRVRSYVILWLSRLGRARHPILQRLDTEPDVTIRRALMLALGNFTDTQLSLAQRQPLIEKLLMVYENEPDAGLHGAAEWLLRKWGQGERLEAVVEKLKSDDKQLQARKANGERQWYVNTQKQTFVIMHAGEFLMGSPKSEPYRYPEVSQHRRRIGRRFAIATTEVTREQFGRFQTARPEIAKEQIDQWVKTGDSPQVQMTWYEAAAYCDWLSEREGLPKEQWCYERNEQGKYAVGMKAKDKFWELTGYRLPTEAEWEFACRAGTLTSRYYGMTEDLLAQYAWYQSNGQNRTWPIGSLKPNDVGLFDMLGNVWEWCFDLSVDYPRKQTVLKLALDKVVGDVPSVQPVEDTQGRVLRGGAFNSRPENVRSAFRLTTLPVYRSNLIGFRPARTYP